LKKKFYNIFCVPRKLFWKFCSR